MNSLAYNPPVTKAVGPGRWTNVFGYDDVTYQSIFNEINGYGYGNIASHITPPAFETPSIWSNGYGYVNYGASNNFDTAYIAHDGRIVKQYAVHERHHNDLPDPLNYQPRPNVQMRAIPTYLVPNNINVAQPRTLNVNRNFNQSPNDIPTFLNKNHGPIALGSGSLGVIRLPNGEVYLGSGSLGYISHKDHYDNVMNIASRRQQPLPRGPTSFGHHL